MLVNDDVCRVLGSGVPEPGSASTDQAKTALMLMLEYLRCTLYGADNGARVIFEEALASPSYPSGANVRVAFRGLYSCVECHGDDEALRLTVAVAEIMGVESPHNLPNRQRPARWDRTVFPKTTKH